MNEFYFKEYCGCEIHRYVKDCKNPAELPPVKDVLKLGEEVFVNIFGRWSKGTIIKSKIFDGEEGFWADTFGCICPLDFDKDDRHCWICSGAINKAAIQITK